MSILKMFLGPAVKELEHNPKVVELVNKAVAAEAVVAPILAKVDQNAVAQAIASFSGGKITKDEVQAVETEIANLVLALGGLVEELKTAAE
jgi:hypothetical protein